MENEAVRLYYSYAHNDEKLADGLIKQLRVLERLGRISTAHARLVGAGKEWRLEAAQGLDEADVILLLVSSDFLASDYLFEDQMGRALVRHQHGQARVVPVLLRPSNLADTPLEKFVALPSDGRAVTQWKDRDEAWLDVDRGLREILTALRPQAAPEPPAPGPPAQQSAAPDRDSPDSSEEPRIGPLAVAHDHRPLHCDRTRQWSNLHIICKEPGHRIVLLPGARGQGHEYFLLRVQLALSNDPPRRILPIDWKVRPFPKIKPDYLGALAEALRCSPADLGRELLRKLTHANLILLHPCVREGFDDRDGPLARYYGEWLPELLEGAVPGGYCKCIQPIEWRSSAPGVRLMARLASVLWPGRPRWVQVAFAEVQARGLMGQIEARARQPAPVYTMPDLEDIKREHVADFCQLISLPVEKHKDFIDAVMSGARTSTEVIQAISDYLPREK